MMQEQVTLATQGLVVALYLAVAGRGVMSAYRTPPGGLSWTRRATVLIFVLISTYWAAFYIHLITHSGAHIPDSAQWIAMWSRVGHVIAAVGMWTVISFIKLVANYYKRLSQQAPS